MFEQEVLYQPKFTYIRTLAEARFPRKFPQKSCEEAVKDIARTFLQMAELLHSGNLPKPLALSVGKQRVTFMRCLTKVLPNVWQPVFIVSENFRFSIEEFKIEIKCQNLKQKESKIEKSACI